MSSRNHGQNAHSSRVRLVAHCNGEVPLEENRQQVLLELAAGDGDRSGLDLVAVLDVSGSMKRTKLEETKIAMQFVIKKLSPMDRLSIVTFSDEAEILFPLCNMTEVSKAKLKRIVDGLKDQSTYYSTTNMAAGLEMGLLVLADGGRDDDDDRVASIIFMSDGVNNIGVDPTTVDVRSAAVYTFGFGDGHDATSTVLDKIARKSRGGTFNNVTKVDDLTTPFSTILGGLLSVAVKDLKLTVWEHPGHSKIEKVDGGSYPQTQDAGAGAVTVSFGYLYAREVRKVIVDLFLPAAVDDLQQAAQDDATGPGGDHKPCCSFRTVCCCWSRPRAGSGAAPAAAVRRGYVATVITAQCSYRIKGGKHISSPAVGCSIRRTGSADPTPPPPPTEVKMELVRRRHANVLGEAIVLADFKELNSARSKLQVELKTLDVEGQSSSNSDPAMIGICRTEVETSIELAKSPGTYDRKGRAFMRSAKTSHDIQRVATRGADVDQAGPFITPRMVSYARQAQQFKENPDMQPPSVEQDLITERRSPQPAPAVTAEGRIWWGRC